MNKTLIGRHLILIGLIFSSSAVFAQKNIAELSQQLDQISSHQQQQNEKVARALNQLNEMKLEFQAIKGQLHSSQHLENESKHVYQDLDMRVTAIEDKLDQLSQMIQDSLRGSSATGSDVGAEVLTDEQKEFQKLLAVFNAKDYRNAASGWMGFLKKYPEGPYASKSQYWLAESFYYLEDFAKSIQEFQVFVEKYPQDKRVKEAFYKQGMGFFRLKRPEQAKLFFQKVVSDYPNSAEAYKATSRIKQLEGSQENVAPSLPAPSETLLPAKTSEDPVDPTVGAPVKNES